MTSVTTRTGETASATGPGRRRTAPGVGIDWQNPRVRDTWQESASQVVEVGRVVREQCLAELRRTLNAPAWTAAVAAMRPEGGEA